jgi:hypothetical protein
MVANSFLAAVAEGVVPHPLTRPRKATFEFSNGQTLTLEDSALREWWLEYTQLYAMYMEVQSNMARMMQGPLYRSDQVHEAFSEHETKTPPVTLKDDKDKKKE